MNPSSVVRVVACWDAEIFCKIRTRCILAYRAVLLLGRVPIFWRMFTLVMYVMSSYYSKSSYDLNTTTPHQHRTLHNRNACSFCDWHIFSSKQIKQCSPTAVLRKMQLCLLPDGWYTIIVHWIRQTARDDYSTTLRRHEPKSTTSNDQTRARRQ